MARIAPMTPIYQRGQHKRHLVPDDARQRRPRKRDKKHLVSIARLPCVVPGCGRYPVHVAHIRFASALDGACHSGKSVKPDDWRTLPLCPCHHTEGPVAQHAMNEEAFWMLHGINPYALARALHNLSGHTEKMWFLIEHARELFPIRQT